MIQSALDMKETLLPSENTTAPSEIHAKWLAKKIEALEAVGCYVLSSVSSMISAVEAAKSVNAGDTLALLNSVTDNLGGALTPEAVSYLVSVTQVYKDAAIISGIGAAIFFFMGTNKTLRLGNKE